MSRCRFFLPGLALTLLLTGCVKNTIYRPGPAAVELSPVVTDPPSPAHFKLGMIEFDDMGESWEKCTDLEEPANCQLTRVLDLIRKEKQRSGDVVVVLFVHGWKNNASPENEKNGNLFAFKNLMEKLADGEALRVQRIAQDSGQKAPPARSYIGIYMAWRGQSIPGVLSDISFWNRRDAAQRVGSSDFAEAVYRIMGATKENSPKSRVVVVGHSFGARALEDALTNTFVSLLVPQPDGKGQVKPPDITSPADLILYVNSANDSFRTKQMIELMKRTDFKIVRGDQLSNGPLFLSITSTGDSATGTAFPLGQDLSALSKSFRHNYGEADFPLKPPPQKTFFTHTPGHIPFLLSHQVHAVTGDCPSSVELFRFRTKGVCYEMTPVARRWNDSPFWDVTVPPSIIRNHSDIFNASFSTMIIDLIEQYRVLDSPQQATMTRNR